jgi:hypothetical protein
LAGGDGELVGITLEIRPYYSRSQRLSTDRWEREEFAMTFHKLGNEKFLNCLPNKLLSYVGEFTKNAENPYFSREAVL